jgi:voltage-gated potassium channel
MATFSTPELSEYERSHILSTGIRAIATASILLALYFNLPTIQRAHQSILLRVTVALAFFVAVLLYEIRQISRHDQPTLRATVAMATVIPLFIVLFSWIYLTMSRSDPGAFGGILNRVQALYFTVTIFSTVGFGDITPKTDAARLVTTVQMMADLVVLALVVRLILAAASRGAARLQGDGSE